MTYLTPVNLDSATYQPSNAVLSDNEVRPREGRERPPAPQTITVHDWFGAPLRTNGTAGSGRKIYVGSALD